MPEATRIRVINKHNSGAFGEVWAGEQVELNRKVAIKVIKVDMADKASAKAHALKLANLHHACIVTVHSLEEVELPSGQKVEAIIMEWLEGETLGKRLKRGGIEKEELFTILDSMIQGLRHMHKRSVFHGDLHAGNVIIGDSFVKIIDISATDSKAITRFSTMSRDMLVAADVASLAYNLRFCINRCTTDFSPLSEVIEKLPSIQSIDEFAAILELLKEFDPLDERDDEESEQVLDRSDLTELDTTVLKMCGDTVVNGRDISEVISCPRIVQEASKEGFSQEEILDSIEVLGDQGIFREGNSRYSRFVQISTYGMDYYLRAFYPEYDKAFRAVKVAIVRDGIMGQREIAAHVNRPLPVVQHFIDLLESNFNCTVSKTNMGHKIVEISARLRRDLR